jgi:hypothetical protein
MAKQDNNIGFMAHPPGADIEKAPIDMWAGYPSVKQAKWMQKLAPKCWQLFFSKKYQLPAYRTSQYSPQDFINYIEWSSLIGLPYNTYRDDIMNACFCNTAGSLYHGRPTLFLERELGVPLVNGPLPNDMMAEDFKWKWPTFKVYLPDRLIELDDKHWLMFLDIGLLEENEGRSVPGDLAEELNAFAKYIHPNESSQIDFSHFNFYYPDRAIVVSGIMNSVDGLQKNDLTTYALVKPFKKYTVAEIKAMSEHLKSAWKCDKADDSVTAKAEHLALQILLFLSAYPLEYEPKVVRPPSRKGDRQISGIYNAKFVGQSQIRPKPGEPHHIASAAQVIGAESPGGTLSYEKGSGGWHVTPHWRSGHWVRQPYGPGSRQRKLIWVNTMPVGYQEEEEENKK